MIDKFAVISRWHYTGHSGNYLVVETPFVPHDFYRVVGVERAWVRDPFEGGVKVHRVRGHGLLPLREALEFI